MKLPAILLAAVLAACPAQAQQAGDPILPKFVWNVLPEKDAAYAPKLEETYRTLTNIGGIREGAKYTPAKAASRKNPKPVMDESGKRVEGTVVVGFIIGFKGEVLMPFVLKSSDPRLDAAALEAVAQWKFKPFQKDNAMFASTGVEEFAFRTP